MVVSYYTKEAHEIFMALVVKYQLETGNKSQIAPSLNFSSGFDEETSVPLVYIYMYVCMYDP
jgi:hypothetical protein